MFLGLLRERGLEVIQEFSRYREAYVKTMPPFLFRVRGLIQDGQKSKLLFYLVCVFFVLGQGLAMQPRLASNM